MRVMLQKPFLNQLASSESNMKLRRWKKLSALLKDILTFFKSGAMKHGTLQNNLPFL